LRGGLNISVEDMDEVELHFKNYGEEPGLKVAL
jgi:hypothetical protein